jgi:hypothetical protein
MEVYKVIKEQLEKLFINKMADIEFDHQKGGLNYLLIINPYQLTKPLLKKENTLKKSRC